MSHSKEYSRGIHYARREYKTAETKFQQMKVLTKLESDANSVTNKSLFEQGIIAFIKEQREINKK